MRFFLPGIVLAGVVLSAAASYAQNPALGGGQRHRTIEPTCPTGSVLINGRCARPQVQRQCPPGSIGVFPNCRPVVRSACPSGTIGVYPNCRPTVKRPPPLDEQSRMPNIPPAPPTVRIPEF